MQQLNAAAVFAVAFVLTVFAVTLWLHDGAPLRAPAAETVRVSVPLVSSPQPATLNRLIFQGG